MLKKLKRIFLNFLSANIRGSLINEDVRKATLINLFAICGIFFLLFYSHRMYLLGDVMLSYIYTTCVVIIVLLQIYLRVRRKILIVSHILVFGLFCIEIFFLIRNGSTLIKQSGYYVSPGIYWYYIFPPFSIFMLGRKIGSYYNIALITLTILFFSFDYFENDLYDFEFEVRLISIYSAIFLFSFFFELIRSITFEAYDITQRKNRKLLDVISVKNTHLSKKNVELSNLTEEIRTQMDYLQELNVELQDQNEKIAKQNIQLESQSKEILSQRDMLIQYKKNIDDSITYASYIQNALLPVDDIFKETFEDSFIINKPKNIIGGDFYFIKKIDEYIIVAAADCTGHGVPGALLSMLGIASLSEIVHRKQIDSTSEMLNDIRREFISVLSRKDHIYDAKDGMDISLCKINTKTLELQFSGAFNPIFIVRESKPIELIPDKIVVGSSMNENRLFTHQNFQLKRNDCLYLFSDGYEDQLGGEANRKFMKRDFQELLMKISSDIMTTQRIVLEQAFENWKGENDQTDDVLVIGIRV